MIMCGFAGILTSRADRRHSLKGDVELMSGALTHRGPDDGASWVDPACGIGLGFRRLSILDLSGAGRQPMHSPSGRFVLTFNGEVYNFRAIRASLEPLGYRFRGSSDTEVLLCAIEEWGLATAISMAVGMFAVALWDRHTRTLHLVRDRLGVKPLYFAEQPGLVLFGSELRAFERHPGFDAQVCDSALTSFLRYLMVPGPTTIYQSTRKVLPGEWVSISGDGEFRIESRRYWSLEEAATHGLANAFDGQDHLQAIEELDQRLLDSVRLRLEADVPLGALLSGGIDSSAVVAAMSEVSHRRPQTYTIGFDVEADDESRHAAAVAGHLGTDHHELMVSGSDALAAIPEAIDAFDEPFADPSQIPSLMVCRLARSDVTVVLAGDGGDELFGGYNRHSVGISQLPYLAMIPRPLRRLGALAIRSVPERGWDPLLRRTLGRWDHRWTRSPGRKLGKLAELIGSDAGGDMYRGLLSHWADELREDIIFPDPVLMALRSPVPDGPLARMLLADQLVYLPDDLLTKADRTSMAESLELRVPLLDHRLVELSWRIPDAMKIRGGEGKWILRKVLERRVPRHLWDRPKVGFSVPLGTWLRGALRPWAEGLLHESRIVQRGILTNSAVQDAWRGLQRGEDRYALRVWTVAVGETWMRARST